MWNLIGHQRVLEGLDRALAAGRLAQAYLLVGPAGTGKATLARAMARAVNCLQPQPGPCGECPQCRRITGGLHPDVTVTEVEGGRRVLSIEQVRELQHSLSLRPFEGRCRVAVLPEADRLTPEASNALLKTLEEPAPDTLLILCAGDEADILPTIRSRCQTITLLPVPTGVIATALEQLPNVTPEHALEAAAFGRGRPGLALRALNDPTLIESVRERLALLREAMGRDIAGRLAQASAMAGGSANAAQREALIELLESWLHWWRDALLVKAACDGPLVFPPERDAYHTAADQLDLAAMRNALEAVRTAQQQVELNANPRLVIDVLLLELPRLRPAARAG